MKQVTNKKQRIISVALDLFLEKGFANTSVDEIVNQAEISKGSFYNYFSSKDRLLEEIVGNAIKDIEQDLEKKIEVTRDPLVSIENYFKTNIELSKKYTPAILISLREAGIFPISGRESLSTLINMEIRGAIKSFISSIKGNATDEEVSMLWGITLSVWIDLNFNNISPSTSRLSHIVWEGMKWKK